MATGDTIGGSVRVVLEDTQGNRNVVLGSLPQDKVDYFNNDVNQDAKQYVNTMRSNKVTAPAGAQKRSAPDAVFEAGEKIIIQHQSSNDSGRDIDHTTDSYNLEGVTEDLNRGNSFGETLTQSNQQLTGTSSESATGFVDIFSHTIPDRQRFFLAGEYEAVAVEN